MSICGAGIEALWVSSRTYDDIIFTTVEEWWWCHHSWYHPCRM